jgi:hypothetical protein
LSLAALVLALPPALSPIERDLLLVVVLRLLALRLLVVRLSCPLSLPSLSPVSVADIYNIASHKGLKGEIDTRLLTKNGRIQIAKDIKKSGMIASAIQQIVNTDRAELYLCCSVGWC